MRPSPSVPFPQRQQIPRFGAVAAWLSSPRPFCRPSAWPCPSVPFPQRQRFPRFGAVAAWLSSPRPFCRPSVRPSPSVPFPQRQQIPRLSAVAAWLSSPRPFYRPSARSCPSVPFPQRQQIPRFGAVAESHSSRSLVIDSLNGIVYQNPFHQHPLFHLPKVFLIPVDWQVPIKVTFFHHLLLFVIARPAPEAPPVGLAPIPHREGADQSALSPAPS